MRYTKDGVFYSKVNSVVVNGMQIINPTHEQILSAGYEVLAEPTAEELAKTQAIIDAKNAMTKPVEVDKLAILLDSIKVETPSEGTANEDGTLNLPYKVGYSWKPYLNGDTICYELVEDKNAYGTADNPIPFDEGMPLLPNAYYTYNDTRYVYMGAKGTATTWDACSESMAEF